MTLSDLGRDLTGLAKAGSLDAVLGRDREIAQLLSLLQQSGKRNILVIGEPGVGKTRLIEGIAIQLVGSGDAALQRLRLHEMEANRLVAGTMYRGQFEERLDQLVRLLRTTPDLILFVDEVHLLVGAGQTMESTQDAANTLKPYLARGEITMIGATTCAEYETMLARDSAFIRRFHLVKVTEPTQEVTLAILEAAARRAAAESGVVFTRDGLVEIIRLADGAIPDRRQPDKSVDLMRRFIAERRTTQMQTAAGGEVGTAAPDVLRRQLRALRDQDYSELKRQIDAWFNLRANIAQSEFGAADVVAMAPAVLGGVV